MVDFKENVIVFIKRIPRGKVVSYGQVAAACGSPRAARQVGGILKSLEIYENNEINRNSLERRIPWWRVVNSKGMISIKGNWTATKELQKQFLEQEGILVGNNFSIDMEKYQFRS
jgi:methylated-DNA-protein-cysteine methyltransferase related protein